jgi:hypothetical protein
LDFKKLSIQIYQKAEREREREREREERENLGGRGYEQNMAESFGYVKNKLQ